MDSVNLATYFFCNIFIIIQIKKKLKKIDYFSVKYIYMRTGSPTQMSEPQPLSEKMIPTNTLTLVLDEEESDDSWRSLISHEDDSKDDTPEVVDPETGYRTPRPLRRYRAYAPKTLYDEPLSPVSVTSLPVFPQPTPMTRSPALCYNTTWFNEELGGQSYEASDLLHVVREISFSWYET